EPVPEAVEVLGAAAHGDHEAVQTLLLENLVEYARTLGVRHRMGQHDEDVGLACSTHQLIPSLLKVRGRSEFQARAPAMSDRRRRPLGGLRTHSSVPGPLPCWAGRRRASWRFRAPAQGPSDAG